MQMNWLDRLSYQWESMGFQADVLKVNMFIRLGRQD